MTSEQVMENLRHYVEEREHKTVAIFTPDGRSSGGVLVPVHLLEYALKEIALLRLTDEERETIGRLSFLLAQHGWTDDANTLRGLLERTERLRNEQ